MQNIGVLGLLGIIFVTLKLIGYIQWSWWLVTIPFWLPTLLLILFIAGLYIYQYFK